MLHIKLGWQGKGNISGNQWNLWNQWPIEYLIDFWRHKYIRYLQKSMGHFHSQDIISPKINETEMSDISQISKNQWEFHWFLETYYIFFHWFLNTYKKFFLFDFWRHIGSYHLPLFWLLRVLSTCSIRNLLTICFKGGSLFKNAPNFIEIRLFLDVYYAFEITRKLSDFNKIWCVFGLRCADFKSQVSSKSDHFSALFWS